MMQDLPDAWDVIVIGAGPAGLAAAATTGAAGLTTLVLDENPAPGGQIYRSVEGQGIGQPAGPDDVGVELDNPAGRVADGLEVGFVEEVAGQAQFVVQAVVEVVAPEEFGYLPVRQFVLRAFPGDGQGQVSRRSTAE